MPARKIIIDTDPGQDDAVAILLPEVGRVHVAGYTRSDLEAVLAERYSPYYETPTEIVVDITTSSKVFWVLGEVRNGGEFEFLGGVPERFRVKNPPIREFGDFAMWDLPEFEILDGNIVSRVCDDLVGCAAIVWDRVFGTFGDSAVIEAGVGPREPTIMEKLLMPIREPVGSVIAPAGRSR